MFIDGIAQAIESELPEENRPDDRAQELYRLYALLVLAKGRSVTLADVHNAWCVWMVSQNPHHPSLVQFDRLDRATQLEDEPYRAALLAVARRSSADSS